MSAHRYSQDYFERRAASPLFSWEARLVGRGIAGMKVVEVGSGAGELAARIGHKAASYTTTDHVAQPGEPPDILCSADELPFTDGSVDVIIAQHVVEHLDSPADFFEEALRVLAPGGRLRLTTPNAKYADPEIFADPTHVSVWGTAAWRAALCQAGFTQVHAQTYFPYLGHAKLLYTSARVTQWTHLAVRNGAVVYAEGLRP